MPGVDVVSSSTEPPPRPRRGVWLYPGIEAARLVSAVVAAEEAGLDEVWIADEGVAREPMPVLAAASQHTETIRLGVGITSPLLRHPGAIASSAATLDELSQGRAVLGFGVGGSQSLDPFGLSTERPVGVVREAIDMARAVLGGVAIDGYTPPDHAMAVRPLPVWVGARGPQLCRLAARRADGLFVSGCTEEEHHRIVGDVRAIDPDFAIALYQSAGEMDGDSVQSWDAVAVTLDHAVTTFRPAALGINLVDLIDAPDAFDPVPLIHRAADALPRVF